jgi:hypothetical protein
MSADPVKVELDRCEALATVTAEDIAALLVVVVANPDSKYSGVDTLHEIAYFMSLAEVIKLFQAARVDPSYSLLYEQTGTLCQFFGDPFFTKLARADSERKLADLFDLDELWKYLMFRVEDQDEDTPKLWRVIGDSKMEHKSALKQLKGMRSWDMAYTLALACPCYRTD